MRSREADIQRIADILDSIHIIQSTLEGKSDADFYNMETVSKWGIVKLIENIGEAANHISDETKALSKNTDWRVIIGMRNRLVHGYDRINYVTVYEVAKHDLLQLKEEVELLKEQLQKEFPNS
jgi:uncharacterized protein with HEPN domain